MDLRFKCLDCPKKFKLNLYLQNHAKTCTGFKDYIQCDGCVKIFKTQKTLNAHKIKCNPHRKYECKECGDLLESYSLLFDHSDKEHKYVACDICEKEFHFKNINRHKKTVHAGFTPAKAFLWMKKQKEREKVEMKCEECFKYFFDKSTLNRHKKRHMKNVINAMDNTVLTTVDTTVLTTGMEDETPIAWSTWSISDQARGKKRKRGRPDKVYNWTRRLCMESKAAKFISGRDDHKYKFVFDNMERGMKNMNMLAGDEEDLLEASLMNKDDKDTNTDAVVMISGVDNQKYVEDVPEHDESNLACGKNIQTDSETLALPVYEESMNMVDVVCIESNFVPKIVNTKHKVRNVIQMFENMHGSGRKNDIRNRSLPTASGINCVKITKTKITKKKSWVKLSNGLYGWKMVQVKNLPPKN